MLLLRSVLAVAMIGLGGVILVRMLAVLPAGRFAILPGVVLGAAMIALGVHRLKLIARVRGMR
ncbi:MAG TPA: hypothetical protein VHX17_07650 [Candidatus Cybelea sp.]|jgi:hypothetical protein|nr:hypothetical protein [Candidatus Cybelea sp.]